MESGLLVTARANQLQEQFTGLWSGQQESAARTADLLLQVDTAGQRPQVSAFLCLSAGDIVSD